MQVETTRFGTITVTPEQVLTFPDGLFAFEDCHHFVLIEKGGHGLFCYLQSLERPELAFVVIDPRRVDPGYQPVVTRQEIGRLGLNSTADATLLAIVVVPKEVGKMTANFQAPLVINPETMQGCQLISTSHEHLLRQPIFSAVSSATERKTG
jgi:flagellar assembly factor FliW